MCAIAQTLGLARLPKGHYGSRVPAGTHSAGRTHKPFQPYRGSDGDQPVLYAPLWEMINRNARTSRRVGARL